MLKLALAAITLVATIPSLASAQALCTNMTGLQTAVFEQWMPNGFILRLGSNGPGGGDDRIILRKTVFHSAGGPFFDPVSTHNLHITLRKNSHNGPILWSASLPAGTNWNQTASVFRYADPTTSNNGVRLAKIRDYGGGQYIGIRHVIRNQNLPAASIPGASDNVHMLLEYERNGIGACIEGVTSSCFVRPSGNVIRCSG